RNPVQDNVFNQGRSISRGRRQPYAGLAKLFDPLNTGNGTTLTVDSPVVNQQDLTAPLTQLTIHTFGKHNNPLPQNQVYDWLVHLDRQLISPMELLHVSGMQPHQLTQFFMTGSNSVATTRFQHYVPWFDESRRLYRAFEFLTTHSRATGLTAQSA